LLSGHYPKRCSLAQTNRESNYYFDSQIILDLQFRTMPTLELQTTDLVLTETARDLVRSAYCPAGEIIKGQFIWQFIGHRHRPQTSPLKHQPLQVGSRQECGQREGRLIVTDLTAGKSFWEAGISVELETRRWQQVD
jgi:hypothetical protein